MNLMEIKIDEAQLIQELHAAIIKSALGQTLAEVAKSAVNGYHFRSAVDKAVATCVERVITQELLNNAAFKEHVAKAVNEGVTQEVIDKLVKRSLKLDRED